MYNNDNPTQTVTMNSPSTNEELDKLLEEREKLFHRISELEYQLQQVHRI